jgi:hypothetical protein
MGREAWTATDASRHDGAQLPNLVDKTNTASDVWADTADRSAKNERHLVDNGLRSQIHRKGIVISGRAPADQGLFFGVALVASAVMSSAFFCGE